MSAEKYPTFVNALPVLGQVKMHLSIVDMFTTECPDENVKKFLENYGSETFMPSIISTLETIRLGMLDDFKKRFAGMTINLLWPTLLDPWCCSLKHLSQNETEVARNKLIKEVMNVSSEEAEVITVDEEGHGSKRNTIKGFNIFDSPEKKSSSAATADNAEAEEKLLWQKSANREVENYLDLGAIKVPSDVIPMDWWKFYKHQFPRIAKLARKWLCVTATSTPSERVFSDCG